MKGRKAFMRQVVTAMLVLTILFSMAIGFSTPAGANGPIFLAYYDDSGGGAGDVASAVAQDDDWIWPLGEGSWVTFEVPFPFASADGTSAPEIMVDTVPDGIAVHGAHIFVSDDNLTWTGVGLFSDDSAAAINLDATPFTGYVKYVKVVGADDYGQTYLNYDLDAAELLIPSVDITPPEVYCIEGVNPNGKAIPPAGNSTLPGPKGGQNEDGFYQISASDNLWPTEQLQVFVTDTGSGTVFGPFPAGVVIKYTEDSDATPELKAIGSGGKGKAGFVAAHIIGTGDPCVIAVDGSGNVSSCSECLVPQPPK